MDAVSYSHADKQKQRIEKFIKQPDSTSGIVTVPDTIASGESIEIATGRQIVVDHLDVQGTLDIQGTLATVTGGYLSQTTMKTQAIAHTNGTNAMTIDSSGNVKLGSNYLTPYTGFKNYIINGNFDVWQRGTSQTSSGYGSDDRWSNNNVGSTKTHSQVACGNTERALFNAQYFSRTVVYSLAGAANHAVKFQLIEDVTKFSGKTVTLSFWAKADSNKNIAIEFIQRFGTGGTPSSEVNGIGSQLVSLTTTWQKKTVTVTLPSIAGKTLGTDGVHTTLTVLYFWFDVGSDRNSRAASLGQQSGTFDIAQVQLEEGSVATPFENRPYGLELSLCQRYYKPFRYLGGAQTISTTQLQFAIESLANMRVTPTLTNLVSGGGSGVIYSTYGSSSSTQYFAANCCVCSGDGIVTATVSGLTTGVASVSIVGTASAEL